MKARPLTFTAPMIQALLSGRKTMTRRAVKPQPFARQDDYRPCVVDGRVNHIEYSHAPVIRFLCKCQCLNPVWYIEDIRCPYGRPGDLLWCKEVWREIRSPARPSYCEIDYRADGEEQRLGDMDGSSPKWRSSRFMPRHASRLTLALTDVRVERVQQISEADARSEGICELPLQAGEPGCWWTADASAGPDLHGRTAIAAFAKLWDSIHDLKSGNGWASNPWVWVLSFRAIQANVNAVLADPAGYGLKVAA